MKHIKLYLSIFFVIVTLASKGQTAFTPGNIVVCRIGNGGANILTSGITFQVFIDEYTPAGVKVRTIAMPTLKSGANHALTLNPDFTGLITRSPDGRYLTLLGLDTIPGVTSYSQASVTPRTVALIKYDGSVNATTALRDCGSNETCYSAITSNGTDIWTAASGDVDANSGINTAGVRYTTIGSTTSVQVETKQTLFLKSLQIANSGAQLQLYLGSSAGNPRFATVGSGLPKTSGQVLTLLPGINTGGGYYQSVFLDENPNIPGVDVLYIIDGTTGIRKYSFNGTAWIDGGFIDQGSNSFNGLTGTISGNTVTLFASKSGSNNSIFGGDQLVKFVDATGYNGNITTTAPSATTLVNLSVSDPANYPVNTYSFAGLALVPSPPASQSITYPTLPAKTYGSIDFDPGASSSSGLPVTYSSTNTSVATIVNGKIHIVGAGTATISVDQLGGPGVIGIGYFQQAATVSQTLTVTQAPLTITADNQNKLYGQPNPTLTVSYSGFVNGETSSVLTTQPTITSTATTNSIAGTYPITANGAVAANYTITYVAGTLTVSAQNQVITFNAIPAKIYGIADFAPGATTTSGLGITYTSSNTSVATIVNGNIHIVGVGATTITASQAGNANYTTAANVTQVLTVTPSPQTLNFGPIATRTYGDPDFSPATLSSPQTITYTSSNQFTASIVNGQVHINGAGTATITASVATNPNYIDVAPITQTLTVNKASQTITLGNIPNLTKGTAYTLNATVSSGLTPTITIADNSVATANGNSISPVHIGTSSITVTQAGNTNYLAATPVNGTITVVDAANDEIVVHQGMSPNGDGINDTFIIENIKSYPDNHVTVINRNGAKIYEATGYNNSTVVFDGTAKSGTKAEQGTYFYQVTYTVNGTQKTHSGYLVIKY